MLPIPFGRRPLSLWQAAALFAAALLLFFAILVIVVGSGSPADRDCRDAILSQIPIYPAATLVTRDESGSKPAAGSEWREYQTTDSVDDVAAFYRAMGYCVASDDGGIVCDGKLAGDHRVSYQARIRAAGDTTSVSLFIGWYCGTNG